MNRKTVAEIDLSAIAHNLDVVKRVSRNRPVIAVVKADAYGHGIREVSMKLVKEGTSYLAVAYTSEAVALRDAGITIPIIVLFDRETIEEWFDYHLIPVIHDMDMAMALSEKARQKGKTIKIHVKIDTGMGRLGLSGSHLIEDILKIEEMEGIELVGLMSHFSEADLLDRSFALLQLGRFKKIIEALSQKFRSPIISHIANSAAVFGFEDAHLDAVRPGLMLYGYSPFAQHSTFSIQPSAKNSEMFSLIPAMEVKTTILSIRNMPPGSPISYGRTFVTKRQSTIGMLPVGYADGYNRLFSNNAEVLVKGKRVPVVGRVCMDLTMVDLTEVEDVKERDEVVILGQQGDERITAYELASRAQTIPYEILTSLGSHSKKEYING